MAAVILASSRSDGHTRALAEWAFPRRDAVYEDLAGLRIGCFSYDRVNEDDDFLPLVRRLQAHDVWVLATPLYWYTMSAQAKTFVDRLSDLLKWHQDEGRRLRGRALAVVCAGADPQPPPSFDEPFALTCAYLGMTWLGTHYAQFGDGEAPTAEARESAAAFGARCGERRPVEPSVRPAVAQPTATGGGANVGLAASSWFSSKTEKRGSAIEGRGLFAREAIAAGEIVAVKGGAIVDRTACATVQATVSPAEIQIEDDLYVAPRHAVDVEANILCLNHSCDPNVGVRGQITFVAMRAIPVGHELTIDYAMIDGDPGERMACTCGAAACRAVVTGNDWRLPALQQRYAGYFSRYLQDRIDAARPAPPLGA